MLAKKLKLHHIASLLYCFIASVAQLCLWGSSRNYLLLDQQNYLFFFLEGGVFRLLEAEVKRFDEVYTSTSVPVFQEERLHI
jgi:hypothetical protein